jgi:molybdate transport system substrate-binding protein
LSAPNKTFLTLLFLLALVARQDHGAVRNNTSQAQDLKVAAASDLSSALDKLGPRFEKQTGVHVSVSLGSSGNFFAQIQNGAPFDAFLSADKSYPEKLEQAGKTDGSPVPYARGRLVIWVPKGSSLELPSKDNQTLAGNLDLLTGAIVRKVAIANPEHAPYGRAAVAALKHYGIYDQLKPKIVLGENVSQTAQFAQSGNADVALIPLSLAATGSLEREGRWLLLPEDSYPAIEQAAVVLKSSQNKPQARRFLEFLVSPEGQAVLHDFGFGAPGK